MELHPLTPFRIIDNLYFVGTREASCHMIDTGEGLILIDTGYEECAEIVRDSVARLGFNISDVKIILHSHGHRDHTDATAKILEMAPMAKTYLNFNDKRYIRGFEPDYDVNDGDVIRLGNTSILCLFTPGHTEGSISFFFDVCEDGKVYRAGSFGGAGTNQLKKKYMNTKAVPYLMRGAFLDSIERLKRERVDVFIGNHSWHNGTEEKYARMKSASVNPFINPDEWLPFLTKLERQMLDIIETERRTEFVTYAHRGASQYCPENTMMSFYMGMQMGANGIETDVQRTKDGVLVLFHDNTLERVTGEEGSVRDYTYDELSRFLVKKGELHDKIPTFEDFLSHFAYRDITFAIELKMGGDGIEEAVSDLIYKYGIENKTVVTSFAFNFIKKMRECSPRLKIGYLTADVSLETEKMLLEIGADEICPKGSLITEENVARWHRMGFNVRAWGISNTEVMKNVYDCGADGMTVNFPDRLISYIKDIESQDMDQ